MPGIASGALTVGGQQTHYYLAHDLNTAAIASESARGGDVHGRAAVDLIAVDSRDGVNAADYDDTYSYMMGGTSFAAPVVTGAAADFKHHFINVFGASSANTYGNIYVHMLLMGDGTLESGTRGPTTPPDNLWGHGRLRMRMFNAAGMDAPWRLRWFNWTLSDGDETVYKVNPDAYGVNQDVPEDVEWFKAALWWHEPNLGSTEDPAEVQLQISEVGTSLKYTCSSTAPQNERLWLGSAASGKTWEVTVKGLAIPASTDSSYYYGEQKRRMFLAFFWEDRDRDDGDGPSSDVE